VKARVALVKVYDVGLHVLLIVRVASCTPGSPLDLRWMQLGVRGKSACKSFLLALCLIFSGNFPRSKLRRCFSSIVVRRCRRFYGLICRPCFIVRQAQLGRLAFMSAFPSEMFADRSAGEIHRFSLPYTAAKMWPSPLSGQDRHTEVGLPVAAVHRNWKTGSSGWPALPFAWTPKADRLSDPPLR